MTTLRRTVSQRVRRMTQEQAKEWLLENNRHQRHHGSTIFSPQVRELTGGFNSQSINNYVVRKVYDRAKEVRS